MNETIYTLDTKQKFFIYRNEKVYISSFDRVVLDISVIPNAFVFRKYDKNGNMTDYFDIHTELAEKLVADLHVRPIFWHGDPVVNKIIK